MAISLQNVSIKIDGNIVLHNIDLDIKDGESWVILGENGAGKTTLLNTVFDEDMPYKGTIKRSKKINIERVESTFQNNRLVNQAYQYYQQRYNADDAEIAPTVYDVIQNQVKPLYSTNDASYQLPPKTYTDSHVNKYAKILKIKHLLLHPIVTLSNGETRRVHILNALLKKPKMLLLDNPFIGLDVESRRNLHSILSDIIANGISIIMVCTTNEIPDGIFNLVILKQGKIDKILRGYDIETTKTVPPPPSILDPKLLSKIKKKPKGGSFKYAVRFKGVTVKYDGEKVVDDVHWDIQKGDKWALLGPNGSGKSTLLSLITADNPQGYRNNYALFDRKRGSGESIWDIKKRIGYVSPELQLYANAYNPVWNTVASGLFDAAEMYDFAITDSQYTTVNSYLKLFGLQKLKDKLLHQLSSGQQRLVFLARALVKNPPLLILDEPCQGLDHTNMVYFRELVNELAVSLDKTLIYVTHYEEEIPACVNQIFRIDKGKRV
jgi:molybdate transport system ATP-binding protein